MCEKKNNNSYLVLFFKNLIYHRWGKCFPKERIEKSPAPPHCCTKNTMKIKTNTQGRAQRIYYGYS